jgi:hypothetical protein
MKTSIKAGAIIVILLMLTGTAMAQDITMTRIEAARTVMDFHGLGFREVVPCNWIFVDIRDKFDGLRNQYLMVLQGYENQFPYDVDAERRYTMQLVFLFKEITEVMMDCTYAEQMWKMGITAGCRVSERGREFCPDDPITPWQLDVFIGGARTMYLTHE